MNILKDENGGPLIEYALVLGMLAMVSFTVVMALGHVEAAQLSRDAANVSTLELNAAP